MAVQTKTEHIRRGEYWQRVIAPRDRRTHWPAPCTTSSAFLQDVNGNVITIPSYIQNDGSILLVLDEAATTSLPQTTYYFQVLANPYLPQYNLGGLVPPSVIRTIPVVEGTVTVTGVDYTTFIGTNNNPGPVLSQAANTLDLEWIEGDAISLSFTAAYVNWAGTYTAQIRAARTSSSTLMGTLVVTATFDGTNTNFTMTMSQPNSALIPAGQYYWDLQQVGGVTRLQGSVTVDYQVTA